MPQTILVFKSFKPGGKEIWEEWANELKSREREVLETMKNEHVWLEACFMSSKGDGVYYFMEVEDIDKAREKFKKSKLPIDKQHLEISEKCFEPDTSVNLEPLFAFRNYEPK